MFTHPLGITPVPSFVATDVPLATDNANTVTSSLAVAGQTGTILDLDVNVDISHNEIDDIRLRLVAPNGQEVQLVAFEGGNGNNMSGTTFDDDATTLITDGSAPFNGRFRPETIDGTDLHSLEGLSPNGTWRLRVFDSYGCPFGCFGIPEGTLNSWSLDFLLDSPMTVIGTDTPLNQFTADEPVLTGLDDGSHMLRVSLDAANADSAAPVAVGDLNNDGYDDVALATASELQVFYGAANASNMNFAAPDIRITGAGLTATGGDFNANGLNDIAVLSPASGGLAHVFFDVTLGSTPLTLADADARIEVDGILRPALRFANDRVDLPATLLNDATNLTTTVWLNTTGSGDQAILSGAFSASQNNEYLIFLTSSTSIRVINRSHSAGDETWSNLPVLTDGVDHHIAVVRDQDNQTMELFIDGVSFGRRNVPLSPLRIADNGLKLGQEQDAVGGNYDPNQALHGDLADLTFWDRALTATEIHEVMNGNFTASDPGLRGWYQFRGESGTTVTDSGPNEFHGVVAAGAAAPVFVKQETLVGSLAHSAGLDLNGDRINDLVINAPLATGVDSEPAVGRTYAVYGGLERLTIPSSFETLENLSIPGLGSFLERRGIDRPVTFSDSGEPFNVNLAAGETWFRFSTLGDGQTSDAIRLPIGFLADLTDESGGVIYHSQQAFDLRSLTAGTYYLRVFLADTSSRLNYQAADNAANPTTTTWIGGNTRNITLSGGYSLVEVTDDPRFTHAYSFDGTGQGTTGSFDNFNEQDSASWEVWFRPADVTGNEVLFETGGTGDGMSLNIRADGNGYRVLFAIQDNSSNHFELESEILTNLATFTQAVAVFDQQLDTLQLYVDGKPVGEALDTEGRIQDWSGSSDVGVASENAGHGGGSGLSGYGNFTGEIAAIRFYERAIDPRFTIEAMAPQRGHTHSDSIRPDRDWLAGGDGDDRIEGNYELDRIFGGSGADVITAEPIEVRDRDIADAALELPLTAQTVAGNPPIVIDPVVTIADIGLEEAIHVALGNPVTDDGSGNPVFHETLLESALGSIVELDAGSQSIADLSGLEQLVNLQVLSLADNALDSSDLTTLVPTVSQAGGKVIGLPRLQSLDLTGNAAINDISSLASLTSLRELYLDKTGVDPNSASTLATLASLNNLTVLQLPTKVLSSSPNLIVSEGDTADFDHPLGVQFDGHNDYVTLGDVDALDTPSEFSLSLWFRRDFDATTVTPTRDNTGGERLNVDRTTFATLDAGTYTVNDFRLNVFDHTQGGTVTPMLLTGSPGSYTTLWVGSALDPTANGEQTAAEGSSFTLSATTNVYAGFFTAGLGSGIMSLDINNSGVGNSVTDHDSNYTAPTGPGQTVDGFSNPGLPRTYAFEINVSDGGTTQIGPGADIFAVSTNHGIDNVLVAQSSGASNDNLEIGTEGSNIEIYLDTTDGDKNISFDAGITDGVLHHLAVTFDGSAPNTLLQVFLDGVQVHQQSWATSSLDNSFASPLSFGVARPGSSEWGDFSGLIDNVRIWNRSLSQSEVESDMFGNNVSANLFARYDFDEGVGSSSVDATGLTGNATLSDATWPAWSVSGAFNATGTGTPIQFQAIDDGMVTIAIAGEQFPVLIRNSDPSIVLPPDLPAAAEGQALTLGPREFEYIEDGLRSGLTEIWFNGSFGDANLNPLDPVVNANSLFHQSPALIQGLRHRVELHHRVSRSIIATETKSEPPTSARCGWAR